MRFTGKVALVTGSTKGIGAQMVRRFAAEGASVVVTGRSRGVGQEVAEGIREAGGSAEFLAADISQEADVAALVQGCVDRFGGLHILVNNAAPMDILMTAEQAIVGATDSGFDAVMKVGLYGTFYAIRASIPQMLSSGGGAIVNISSIAGVQGIQGLPAYACMKGAIQALTRQIAADYGQQGIRSNCLIVGPVRSGGITGAATDHPLVQAAMRDVLLTPNGVMGAPDDIAEAVMFLASDAASFINGAIVPVDGGVTCVSTLPDIAKILQEAAGDAAAADARLVSSRGD